MPDCKFCHIKTPNPEPQLGPSFLRKAERRAAEKGKVWSHQLLVQAEGLQIIKKDKELGQSRSKDGIQLLAKKSVAEGEKKKKIEKRSLMAEAEKAYNCAHDLVFKEKKSNKEALYWLDRVKY